MSHRSVYAACMVLLCACAGQSEHPGHSGHPEQPGQPASRSGLQIAYIDHGVRPQDDIYQYFNGKWLASFELPADKGAYGSFNAIDDALQVQLRGIIESLPASSADPDTQKVADMYASFMDEPRLQMLGLAPLRDELAAIEALPDTRALPLLMARFNEMGVGAPYGLAIGLDAKDSTRYAVILHQSGLGMPDRDYYLKDDAKLKDARTKYLAHVERMFVLAGQPHPAAEAGAVLEVETAIARAQWTRVENRDPVKTYNKTTLAELPGVMRNYDWQAYLRGTGVDGKVDYVVVSQPSYFASLGKLLNDTTLPVWKSYFKWRLLSAMAPYLSQAFVDERFAFSGTVLRDVPENQPRWKRGIGLVDGSLGEALGKRYVEQYFPQASKARMQELVKNLLETYRQDIEKLDWMSPETRVGARAKLAKLVPKIGYPDEWRDYGALRVDRTDLVGNVMRANAFEYHRNLARLGGPVDRSEWRMTPQTVNASYNPTRNEITFPAAILQPPFFNPNADDAVNYGGIGAVIGHEVSHGFDDQGSQFDADGNLHDWFTAADHDKFAAKTKALVEQYEAYEPVPDFHINGRLTLGENIADNSGLAIAYKAYQLALAGRVAPVIDGWSGAQRFYLGWVQVWRGKVREGEAIQRVKTDPHSPPAVRGLAPLRNQDAFYEAFDVKPGDRMFLPPGQRVDIW